MSDLSSVAVHWWSWDRRLIQPDFRATMVIPRCARRIPRRPEQGLVHPCSFSLRRFQWLQRRECWSEFLIGSRTTHRKTLFSRQLYNNNHNVLPQHNEKNKNNINNNGLRCQAKTGCVGCIAHAFPSRRYGSYSTNLSANSTDENLNQQNNNNNNNTDSHHHIPEETVVIEQEKQELLEQIQKGIPEQIEQIIQFLETQCGDYRIREIYQYRLNRIQHQHATTTTTRSIRYPDVNEARGMQPILTSKEDPFFGLSKLGNNNLLHQNSFMTPSTENSRGGGGQQDDDDIFPFSSSIAEKPSTTNVNDDATTVPNPSTDGIPLPEVDVFGLSKLSNPQFSRMESNQSSGELLGDATKIDNEPSNIFWKEEDGGEGNNTSSEPNNPEEVIRSLKDPEASDPFHFTRLKKDPAEVMQSSNDPQSFDPDTPYGEGSPFGSIESNDLEETIRPHDDTQSFKPDHSSYGEGGPFGFIRSKNSVETIRSSHDPQSFEPDTPYGEGDPFQLTRSTNQRKSENIDAPQRINGEGLHFSDIAAIPWSEDQSVESLSDDSNAAGTEVGDGQNKVCHDEALPHVPMDTQTALFEGSMKGEGGLMSNPLIPSSHSEDPSLPHRSDSPSNVSLQSALALLRNMSREHWRNYDSDVRLSNNSTRTYRIGEDAEEQEEEDSSSELGQQVDDQHLASREEEHISILSLLQDENFGSGCLVTQDFNIILAHLAISSYLASSDTSDLMLEIFDRMKQEAESTPCAPDRTTYEILMLAFGRRLDADRWVVDLASDLESNSDLWTPMSLGVAFEILAIAKKNKKRNIGLAQSLFRSISDPSSRPENLTIPRAVYRHYISMLLRSNNYQNKILDVLRIFLDENSFTSNTVAGSGRTNYVEGLLMLILSRRKSKSKKSELLVSAANVSKIFDMIRAEEAYQPSFRVLRQFIFSAQERVKKDSSQLHVIRGAFKVLFTNRDWQSLDHKLVAAGLNCAEADSNSSLAACIISELVRDGPRFSIQDETVNRFGSSRIGDAAPSPVNENLTFANISRAMRLCADQGDISSVIQILEHTLVSENNLPFATRQMVMRFSLKACAKQCDPEAAEKILEKMIDNDLQPR